MARKLTPAQDRKYYTHIFNVLWGETVLSRNVIGQSNIVHALQAPETSTECLVQIGKYFGLRGPYGPKDNHQGTENLFTLLKLLEDTSPDALTAFADKLERIFTEFAQENPRVFFRLCDQLSSSPETLSQIVSQDTFRQATENYFSTIQTH